MSVLMRAREVMKRPVVTLGGEDVAEIKDVIYAGERGEVGPAPRFLAGGGEGEGHDLNPPRFAGRGTSRRLVEGPPSQTAVCHRRPSTTDFVGGPPPRAELEEDEGVYCGTTVTARRFCAQLDSSEPVATGRSLP